jgi:hypothetical protein
MYRLFDAADTCGRTRPGDRLGRHCFRRLAFWLALAVLHGRGVLLSKGSCREMKFGSWV